METLILQGRSIGADDIEAIRMLMAAKPHWSRRRLSVALCEQWNWRNGRGRLKDMAARSLLLKLEQRGWIELPPRRQVPCNRMRCQKTHEFAWDQLPLECSLEELGHLQLEEVSSDPEKRARLAGALAQFHYLGYRGTVGENLQYWVAAGEGRPVAFLLFGSSAWKCRERDQWIGWNAQQREGNINLTTNNTRFLILPWVKAPHLASWILGQVLRRLSQDWQNKYGHPILLVETFVERDRFKGTAYQAANWIKVGSTTGRTRQDRDHRLKRPIKDIFIYGLVKNFRERLRA